MDAGSLITTLLFSSLTTAVAALIVASVALVVAIVKK